MSDAIPMAMISDPDGGDWEDISLAEAESLCKQGKAYRCPLCDDSAPGRENNQYNDHLPSFHYREDEDDDDDAIAKAEGLKSEKDVPQTADAAAQEASGYPQF